MAEDPASNADQARPAGRRRVTNRRTDTNDPRRARERALKILFQADVRGVAPETTLARLSEDARARAILDEVDDLNAEEPLVAQGDDGDVASGRANPTPGLDRFTRSLVLGVAEHQETIDALISRYARRWQIHRMPAVDRTVLRLGTYELLYESTPPAVVIDEAVGLAKSLSTDDSGRYVNGVLESVRKDVAARRPDA